MAKYGKAERLEAANDFVAIVANLRAYKDTRAEIYATVTSVSRSGMSRRFDFWVIETKEGQAPWLRRITHIVAALGEFSYDPSKGLRIDGCGMDMGFAAIEHALRAAERLTGREYNSLKQINPSYL